MAYERALAPLVDSVAESAGDVDNAYYVLEEMRSAVSNVTEALRGMKIVHCTEAVAAKLRLLMLCSSPLPVPLSP